MLSCGDKTKECFQARPWGPPGGFTQRGSPRGVPPWDLAQRGVGPWGQSRGVCPEEFRPLPALHDF